MLMRQSEEERKEKWDNGIFFQQKIWLIQRKVVLLHSQTSNNGEVAQLVRAQDS